MYKIECCLASLSMDLQIVLQPEAIVGTSSLKQTVIRCESEMKMASSPLQIWRASRRKPKVAAYTEFGQRYCYMRRNSRQRGFDAAIQIGDIWGWRDDPIKWMGSRKLNRREPRFACGGKTLLSISSGTRKHGEINRNEPSILLSTLLTAALL